MISPRRPNINTPPPIHVHISDDDVPASIFDRQSIFELRSKSRGSVMESLHCHCCNEEPSGPGIGSLVFNRGETAPSPAPVYLGLPLHSRRIRVCGFYPVGASP